MAGEVQAPPAEVQPGAEGQLRIAFGGGDEAGDAGGEGAAGGGAAGPSGRFSAALMESTAFEQLAIRLGAPYCYCHQVSGSPLQRLRTAGGLALLRATPHRTDCASPTGFPAGHVRAHRRVHRAQADTAGGQADPRRVPSPAVLGALRGRHRVTARHGPGSAQLS